MNGAAACLLLEKPASNPAPDKPEAGFETATLRRIGEVTADLTAVLAVALQEYGAIGAMACQTRERGGELFVQLYELQQAAMTDDFPQLMHKHGKRVLWERNAGVFRQHLGAEMDGAKVDGELDELIAGLCSVLARVTRTEKIYQKAWAN